MASGLIFDANGKMVNYEPKGAFLFHTIGVLIVAMASELIRKTRTSTLTQMTVPPKIPAKDGKL